MSNTFFSARKGIYRLVNKEFYTTGEITVLLDISRSTVSRKFDQGVLKGKKNPITGDRFITYDSLMEYMKQYDLPVICNAETSQKKLVAATGTMVTSIIHEAIGKNNNFDVRCLSHGADAMVMCAQEQVDLLIIDNELQDISGLNMLESLQRMEMVDEMKILCCFDAKGNRQLQESKNVQYIEKKFINVKSMKEKINHILYIRDDADETSFSFKHTRLWPRLPLNLPTDIVICDNIISHKVNKGTAIIKDISYGGAFLSQIQFPLDAYFSRNFIFLMKTDHYPLINFEVESQLIRLKSDKYLNAGIKFLEISHENREKILKLSP